LRGNWLVGALLLAAAFLTALYMFRLVFVVFYGKDNVPKDAAKVLDSEPVERTMPLIWIPLVILAIPAAIAGFIGFPPDMGWIHNFLRPVFTFATEHGKEIEAGFSQQTTMILVISTMVAIGGIFVAWLAYYRQTDMPAALSKLLPGLYNALLRKWYFDEFYQRVIVDGSKAIAYGLWRFDQKVIDGTVNGVAGLMANWGGRLRRLQTGFVQGYALAIGVGLLVLVTYLFFILPKG
jgi:NADH-quinone oxidoreductase subunit L